jgi:hypothetical protein
MVRRFLCCVVIAGCTGAAALFAAERATLILTDGERMSGTVMSPDGYSNRGRGRFSPGDLTLLTDDGRRIPIRLDQVAVIQFGGGRPARAELDAGTERRRRQCSRDAPVPLAVERPQVPVEQVERCSRRIIVGCRPAAVPPSRRPLVDAAGMAGITDTVLLPVLAT